MTFSRRDFVKTSVLGAVAAGVGAHAAIPEALAENGQQGHASQADSPKRPIIICAHNGYAYVEAAYAFLKSGGDTLDAGIRVVKGSGGRSQRRFRRPGRSAQRRRRGRTRRLLHARPHAARRFGGRRAQHQECVDGLRKP